MTYPQLGRVTIGAVLLTSLACAPASQDKVKLQAQRVAEFDRLVLQDGMPDSWQTHDRKQAGGADPAPMAGLR